MDPKRTNLLPGQTSSHSQDQHKSPLSTSLSPLGHFSSSPQASSNTNSTTTSGSISPLQSYHSQTTASSPIPLHVHENVSNLRSPNIQLLHHPPSNLSTLNRLLSNHIAPEFGNEPTLHQKTSLNCLSPPRISSSQPSPNSLPPSSADPTFPGSPPSARFLTSPVPARLSPNQSPSKQLPHPSQLPPNQWPTRSSLSDQGSPTQITPGLNLNPISIKISNHIQDPDPNTVRSTQPKTAPPVPVTIFTPSVASHPQTAPVLDPGLAGGTGAPPSSRGGVEGNNSNPSIITYAARVRQYFDGQPILLVEFLLLLKRLNTGK